MPADHTAIGYRGGEGAPIPPPTSTESEQPRDVASLPGSSPTRVGSPASPVHGKERCSSAASTEYSFSDRFSFNSEYEAVLEQTEALYFPRKEHMPASPPTSSPSTESSLIPSTSGEPAPLPAGRRWVAFRGRIPGVYTSSVDATEQTEGFPNAFKLAFEDTAHANHAWNKFLEDGTIPAHGRGPWVVFVGRRQGVFTSYDDLCASVSGFPNNLYRCCESVEEGQRALNGYKSKPEAPSLPYVTPDPDQSQPPVAKPDSPGPTEQPVPNTPKDESWWCCFVGADPGVYMGLENLKKACPAPGGVRRANSEEDGWNLWTTLLLDGQVQVVPRK